MLVKPDFRGNSLVAWPAAPNYTGPRPVTSLGAGAIMPTQFLQHGDCTCLSNSWPLESIGISQNFHYCYTWRVGCLRLRTWCSEHRPGGGCVCSILKAKVNVRMEVGTQSVSTPEYCVFWVWSLDASTHANCGAPNGQACHLTQESKNSLRAILPALADHKNHERWVVFKRHQHTTPQPAPTGKATHRHTPPTLKPCIYRTGRIHPRPAAQARLVA